MGRLFPPPPHLEPRFHQFSPDLVRMRVEHSLKALRTDVLDLLLLHECTPEAAGEARLLETLDALKRQGKIKAYGTATSYEATTQIAARQRGAFDAFQFPVQLEGPPNGPRARR